eukprot:TRINITY_DN26425_c0_g1_i1.p1 TRINITY_DN26425_c0_g1~~TRINITY_DN26425_c0_g1_i1.p1  ORF type:complete len:160 (+),score=23.02 TRINITY_DN26425_c0_g1_i1:538-1017(+)
MSCSALSWLCLLIMGMEIEVDQIIKAIKRPIGPAVGFCTQFLVMPPLAYLLGYLLLETNYERLGLLLLGCCPGGVGSNFWTAMLGGDINLSVTMTFFSSVAAFAMTSFWIWALGTPLVVRLPPNTLHAAHHCPGQLCCPNSYRTLGQEGATCLSRNYQD